MSRKTTTVKAKGKRLLSLDVLRGITIAGMLLVNNPGSWSHIYAPLDHAEWIGLTPTDLVFPFFMFCMGVAMCFSLRKFEFKPSGALIWKIVRRTVLLFLIGWAIGWFSRFMGRVFDPDTTFGQAVNNFATMRYLGVFPRLALCYFFGSLAVVALRWHSHKLVPWLIGVLLVAYAIILYYGHGYEFSLDNIISRVDVAVLGEAHMYHESAGGVTLAFDPEGLLSTIPCIAHTLIGFMAGRMIVMRHSNEERMERLFIVGFSLLLCGWLLTWGIPIGKKMWSTSFVLVTTGLASCVLGLLTYFIDVLGRKRWCRFFDAFGINPLFMYVWGDILAIVFGTVPLWHDADGGKMTIHRIVYGALQSVLDPKLASCLYAILFIIVVWLFGVYLYKKKIIIKI